MEYDLKIFRPPHARSVGEDAARIEKGVGYSKMVDILSEENLPKTLQNGFSTLAMDDGFGKATFSNESIAVTLAASDLNVVL